MHIDTNVPNCRRSGTDSTHVIRLDILVGPGSQQQSRAVRVTIENGMNQRRPSELRARVCAKSATAVQCIARTHASRPPPYNGDTKRNQTKIQNECNEWVKIYSYSAQHIFIIGEKRFDKAEIFSHNLRRDDSIWHTKKSKTRC